MQVIPVIDVRGGVTVAASRGDRANYRTLESPLAASADPVAVAKGLWSLFPFQRLYVADLEGIEGRGADFAMQERLCKGWPGSEVWIDDGLMQAPGAGEHLLRRQVLGSESFSSLEDYARTRQLAGAAAPLSLDFRGDDFIGPAELLADAAFWPHRVIVMTLARVGSGEGPDLARLESIVAHAGAREVYAAGGVRNGDDLKALAGIGVAGALIATALHAGKITRRDIEAIAL
ncbi:HisA/HisF-related TIM barrel protein [Hyphomicrobium sp. LHD-15]|uniref:HisA/HisF-related TIM barrel protein n=1 Tax=Hyphomicrobium sp. LHD-15 TaxID=3072142 RepID=UPI0028104523|nr:HisA/HisF-related TIM barrel protein [Hyphomicrobium sp. LHD-15]MDQ8697399.1 HisA/HisF-related TIM barrel protein [Hyphomicrobium sp. LHD-15]